MIWKKLFLFFHLAPNMLTLTCPETEPSQCDANSHACDMGGGPDGCWLGDYCQPSDVPCPHACYPPMPSQCDENSISCDNGMDMHGCWMGDFCQSMEIPCPSSG